MVVSEPPQGTFLFPDMGWVLDVPERMSIIMTIGGCGVFPQLIIGIIGDSHLFFLSRTAYG
jgi:hypothetical protein